MLSMPSGLAGLDYLRIDNEHAWRQDGTLEHLIRAAIMGGVVPIVRIDRDNPYLLRKALEIGAGAIIVPDVCTVEEAESVVRAAKFPPRGSRGYSGNCWSAGWGARAVTQWLSWLPGGLMHSNIGSCSIFAAMSGSSVATAATIGTIALPQIKKFGYNERLFLGTLAAGGTLGILIPPSINMIVYGVITDTSIPQLYLAGIFPGLLLAALFIGTILIACLIKRDWGGRPVDTDWKRRIQTLPDLIPPLLIIVVVIGSIYAGIATATESAALGVVVSLMLAAWHRRLTFQVLRQAFLGTMRTTAMIMLILGAAFFLNFAMATVGLTKQITDTVTALDIGPYTLMFVVVVFFVVLGCFMETLSMMITTVPVITPIVVAAGFDPVWFGVIVVVLMETALITPPVGVILYVVHGLRTKGSAGDVIIGAAPFVLGMFACLGLLTLFPAIALWLPRSVF